MSKINNILYFSYNILNYWYSGLVHFEGLIVNWMVNLNPNFILVWEVENWELKWLWVL
jgi:hypothetical protein